MDIVGYLTRLVKNAPSGRPLIDRDCVPCRAGTPPLKASAVAGFLKELDGWSLNPAGHLERHYRFPDFASALAFVDRVGALAESVDHHPELRLSWGRVAVELWTHRADGVTETDLVFAAKTERLYAAAPPPREVP